MIQFGLPHGLALRVPGAAGSGARSSHRDSLAGRSAHDTTIRQERWRYGHGGRPGTGARSVPGAGRPSRVCRLPTRWYGWCRWATAGRRGRCGAARLPGVSVEWTVTRLHRLERTTVSYYSQASWERGGVGRGGSLYSWSTLHMVHPWHPMQPSNDHMTHHVMVHNPTTPFPPLTHPLCLGDGVVNIDDDDAVIVPLREQPRARHHRLHGSRSRCARPAAAAPRAQQHPASTRRPRRGTCARGGGTVAQSVPGARVESVDCRR